MSRPALRNAAIVAVQLALRVGLRLLSALVPTDRRVVVSGHPETEGNAIEVLSALLRRYDGRVVWLREPSPPHADLTHLAGHPRLLVADKASPAGLWHYLRAEAVLFTHGLYGSPRPARRKPLVNLWHGDGPKATRPGGGAGSLIPSTYLVSGTALFGRLKATAFEVPEDRLLVTGNPRTDQLWRAPHPSELAALGITGDFVLWMPTFRTTKAAGVSRGWSEGGSALGAAEVAPLVAGLRERGVQLVVKPHPLDAEDRSGPGIVTVTNDDLAAHGVALYELMGRARGLVTDYSSVWVDYLLTDRPIAFWLPDRETYGRELVPADVVDWLPGELVEGLVEGLVDGLEEGPSGPAPFARFLADLDADGALDAPVRAAVADRIGLHRSRSCADDLLDALAARGVPLVEGSRTSLRGRRKGFSSH